MSDLLSILVLRRSSFVLCLWYFVDPNFLLSNATSQSITPHDIKNSIGGLCSFLLKQVEFTYGKNIDVRLHFKVMQPYQFKRLYPRLNVSTYDLIISTLSIPKFCYKAPSTQDSIIYCWRLPHPPCRSCFNQLQWVGSSIALFPNFPIPKRS